LRVWCDVACRGLGAEGVRRANDRIRERFAGPSGCVVRRRPVRMASGTRSAGGSGSCAFPASRSSLPVTRLDLRAFPSVDRLLRAALAGACGRPALVGFAPLSNGATSLSPRSPGPGWCLPTASPGIRRPVRSSRSQRALDPVPLHRPDPRRSPSRGVATASDPSCTLESRSDLAVLHDLAGFLCRLPGVSPDCPPPSTVTEDSRACCIPLPILGFDAFPLFTRWSQPRARRHRWRRTLLDTRARGSPHRRFVPPGGLPLLAAVARHRARCLLGLSVHLRPRPGRRFRFQNRRCDRADGTLSLEALLREQVRTVEHF